VTRRPLRTDEVVRLVLSATCIVVAALTSSRPVDIVAGLPLTLYLTGSALISAIDGDHRVVADPERQVWAVGSSFGMAVAGGLVLNVTGGLTRSGWLVWTAVVIVLCTVVTVVRRLTSPAPDPVAAGGASGSPGPGGDPDGDHGSGDGARPFRPTLRQVLLLLGALAVCGGSLVLSVHTDAATAREPFVQAWVLPQPVDDVASPSAQVGVRNQLGSPQTFRVRVTVGPSQPEVFAFSLAEGATWTHTVARKPGERIESLVTTASDPSVAVNRVFLATPVP